MTLKAPEKWEVGNVTEEQKGFAKSELVHYIAQGKLCLVDDMPTDKIVWCIYNAKELSNKILIYLVALLGEFEAYHLNESTDSMMVAFPEGAQAT